MTRRTSARALAGFCLLAAAALAGPTAVSAQAPFVLSGMQPTATDSAVVQQAAAALVERVGGTLASVDSALAGGGAWQLEITLEDGARWSGTVVVQMPSRAYFVYGEPLQLSPPPGEGDEVDTGSNQAPDEDDDDDDE